MKKSWQHEATSRLWKECHGLPQICVSRTVFEVTRTQAPRSPSLWGAVGPGDEESQRVEVTSCHFLSL